MPPRSSRPRGSAPGRLLLAAVVALQAVVLTADLPTARVQEAAAPPAATTRARVAPPLAEPSAQPVQERTRAVEQLLRERAAAVLRRDREAFLATVDPAATALRARQAALFDALAHVPLGRWDYVLHPEVEEPASSLLDRRYGADMWWAPGVVLRYALAGFDPRPVEVDHHLTFVRRDGRWLLAADDDFAGSGRPTPRALWDHGPVVAVRRAGVLVLGHPGQADLLRDIAALAVDAVPRVTRFWGEWGGRAVLVVPDDAREMAGLLGSNGDLSRLAAVATAELRGGRDEYDPTGDRVVVNPETFVGLGRLGRRVVLTHELTHVATRRASGPAVPAWLAEGVADVVGYSGLDLPRSVTAADLRREVRAGRVPPALPTQDDFAGDNPRLSASYESAELAVRLLVQRHGRSAVLRLYREVGARRGVSSDQALADGLRRLGTTPAAFTADWRAELSRQLG